MKLLATIICCLALSACGSTRIAPAVKVEPVEVKTVVTMPYPAIEVLPRPTLEIRSITDSTPRGRIVQAYQITVQQLLDYATRLEMQIEGINKNAAK